MTRPPPVSEHAGVSSPAIWWGSNFDARVLSCRMRRWCDGSSSVLQPELTSHRACVDVVDESIQLEARIDAWRPARAKLRVGQELCFNLKR